MKPLILLISSAGRRVGLLNCFRADAATLGLDLRIIATDLAPELSAACQAADLAVSVPRADSPDFVARMLDIAKQHNVDLIVPTIDTELQPFADARSAFAEIGTRVAVSDPHIVALARDKQETTRVLAAAGVPVPQTATCKTVTPDHPPYPRIIKPKGGSSSKGIRFAPDPAIFAELTLNDDDIIQREIAGEEYTINMFFDQHGLIQAAVPHLRVETRGGEVSKARTTRHDALTDCAKKVALALEGAKGALCFQVRLEPDNTPRVFEINARFGGGYPIAHAAGAPFSKWLLEEVTGRDSSAHDNWQDGKMMLRWDDAVFL